MYFPRLSSLPSLSDIVEYIATETKWLPFCTRHFPIFCMKMVVFWLECYCSLFLFDKSAGGLVNGLAPKGGFFYLRKILDLKLSTMFCLPSVLCTISMKHAGEEREKLQKLSTTIWIIEMCILLSIFWWITHDFSATTMYISRVCRVALRQVSGSDTAQYSAVLSLRL